MKSSISYFFRKRFDNLVGVLKIKPVLLARRIFRKGLKVLEREAGIGGFVKLNTAAERGIKANPGLSNTELALRYGVAPVTVKEYRCHMALKYLKNGQWQKKTDGAIGGRFGLKDYDIFELRRSVKLFRIRGTNPPWGVPPAKYIEKLGGVEAVRVALREGGKNMSEIFRAGGVRVTRERMRQVVGSVGMTAERERRTPLWYANRLLGPGRAQEARLISSPSSLRKLLHETRGGGALARRFGVDREKFSKFARVRVGLTSSEDKKLLRRRGLEGAAFNSHPSVAA